jgi:energy-coupling factor transporter ATP-binding protein EcfA2
VTECKFRTHPRLDTADVESKSTEGSTLKAIQCISGKLPNTNRNFKINVDGRNVLIVGGNGSGKTSFLSVLHAVLEKHITQGSFNNIASLETSISSLTTSLSDRSNPIHVLEQWEQSLEHLSTQLSEILLPYAMVYDSVSTVIKKRRSKEFFISYFPAFRKAAIDSVSHASGSKINLDSINMDQNLGRNLEQHLVNLRVRAALSASSDKASDRLDEISAWLEKFLDDIRYLFEDASLELHFDPDFLRFSIKQSGKSAYSFQALSSGYLAIFDIYADLLMKTAYLDVSPEKLHGIVLIDEIDVHLHVSLQRKILPFFIRSFPNIQFIVTTHSPFVVTSTTDTLIYDLTSGNESSNLSMYSIEAVVEGLLGVTPVSEEMESTIRALADTTSAEDFDVSEAETILNKISPYAESLDAESRMFYELAINKTIKRKASGV